MVATAMTPDQINAKHGAPVWRCFGCRAETGLHWHHGLSVAVCENPACAEKYDALIEQQLAEEANYREYVESIYGPQSRW